MTFISLGQDKTAIISEHDVKLVRQYTWRAFKNGKIWYARARLGQRVILMHRLIMGFPSFRLDHRNRNGLDNRRSNLREATRSQNGANQKRGSFKGVCWHRRDQYWQAQIEKNGRAYWLGYFSTRAAAKRAYNRAAKTMFGEFAHV